METYKAEAVALLGVSLLDSVVLARTGEFVALHELDATLFAPDWDR